MSSDSTPRYSFPMHRIEEETGKPLHWPRYLPMTTRSANKMTLVLDLDGTLVHSSETMIENPDEIVVTSSKNAPKTFYVKYRPGLQDFLKEVSKNFELVLYTASKKEYAEQVVNRFDPYRKILKYRLYRQDCIKHKEYFVKDLSKLGRDLSQVIILDDSISAFAYHLSNGIPIIRWTDDPKDTELLKSILILNHLRQTNDVRPVLESFFNLQQFVLTLA
jgi:Dullard-like phosphatase family protein